jgi:hypothetical protein
MRFSNNNIRGVVSVFAWLFLGIGILDILALVINFFITKDLQIDRLFWPLINIAIGLGLKKRKPSMPTLLVMWGGIGVFVYGFGLYSSLLNLEENLDYMIYNSFAFGLSVFAIYFFSRKEVRKYFNAKGVTLF